MALTKEEIQAFEREAEEKYPIIFPETIRNSCKGLQRAAYIAAATAYAERAKPLLLKHLSMKTSEFYFIYNNTVHNGELYVLTMMKDHSEIASDFLNRKEVKERVSDTDAFDLSIRLLRAGIKINFMDGDKSINLIKKSSPPLYDRFYKPSKNPNK